MTLSSIGLVSGDTEDDVAGEATGHDKDEGGGCSLEFKEVASDEGDQEREHVPEKAQDAQPQPLVMHSVSTP